MGRIMGTRAKFILWLLTATSLWPNLAQAQQTAPAVTTRPTDYSLKRETTLVGTVQAYTQTSQTPPLGAHLVLQTPIGVIDVHLGDPKFLAANHFSVQPGDTLRVVGETVAYGTGTQFIARIVQKGAQALTVRSVRGIPLSYAAPRTDANSKPQGGAL